MADLAETYMRVDEDEAREIRETVAERIEELDDRVWVDADSVARDRLVNRLVALMERRILSEKADEDYVEADDFRKQIQHIEGATLVVLVECLDRKI